jgi:hypothetical protein
MRSSAAALALCLAACGGAPARTAMTAVPVGAAQAEAEIIRAVETALLSDAAWTDGPAGLYAPGHVVVADGTRRFGYPRFAAIDSGGQVAITSSRVEIGAALAWAYVEYRWVAAERNTARAGLATFVLSPGRTELPWAIVHAHSSTGP